MAGNLRAVLACNSAHGGLIPSINLEVTRLVDKVKSLYAIAAVKPYSLARRLIENRAQYYDPSMPRNAEPSMRPVVWRVLSPSSKWRVGSRR